MMANDERAAKREGGSRAVPFMRGVIPTSENIVVAIWRELEPAIRPAALVRLVLWETANNYVEYTGD